MAAGAVVFDVAVSGLAWLVAFAAVTSVEKLTLHQGQVSSWLPKAIASCAAICLTPICTLAIPRSVTAIVQMTKVTFRFSIISRSKPRFFVRPIAAGLSSIVTC